MIPESASTGGQALRLRLFGGFALEDAGGVPVPLASRKGQALLAYVACARAATVPREALATLFWAERDSHRARQNLRQVLFILSRVFRRSAVPALVLEGQQVALERKLVEIDAVRFETCVAHGSDAALGTAADLYRGDFLAGVAIDSPGFDDWLAHARSRFQAQALTCLGDLVDRHWRGGNLDAAVDRANQALRIDSCREDFHRRLMGLYRDMGMRTSSLTQYRTCRNVLRRELGVAPDEATSALYQAILGDARAPEVAAGGRANPAQFPIAAPAQVRAPDPADDAIVGRAAEVAALRRAFARAARGECRLLGVVGEAGVGKSHLLREFSRNLAAEACTASWLYAHRAERSLRLAPWVELLETTRQADIETAQPPKAELREVQARYRPEAGDAWGGDWRDSFDALVAALRGAAARGPMAVMFEDLHWADRDSVRLLGYAVRRLRRAPVLFVASLRSGPCGPRADIRAMLRDLEDAGLAREILLRPLSRACTGELIRHLAETRGLGPVSRRRAGEVWTLSDGNPGIVVECLAKPSGDGRGGTAQIPASVRRDVARLVARLSPAARTLATVASVMGARGDLRVLRRAAALGSQADLAALEELVEARVLEVSGHGFAFPRTRVRLALFRALLAPRRGALHGAVAEAMAGVYVDEPEPHYGTMARHLRAAGHAGEALFHDLSHADVALNRGLSATAAKIYRRALKSAAAPRRGPGATAALWRARLGLARIAEINRDHAALWEHLNALERGADPAPDPRMEVERLYAAARAHYTHKRKNQAQRCTRRALGLYARHGGEVPWLPAERLFFRLHVFCGSYGRGIERLGEELRRASRLGLRADDVRASSALALLEALDNRFAPAAGTAGEAVRTAQHLGDAGLLGGALHVMAMVRLWSGDHHGALEVLDDVVELAAERGDILRLCAARGYRGIALCLGARHGEAVAELTGAVAVATRLGGMDYLPILAASLAEAELEAGHHGRALSRARDAYAIAQQWHQPWARSVALRVLGRLFVQPGMGDMGVAVGAVRGALAEQRGLGLDVERARSLLAQGRIMRAGGDTGGARAAMRSAVSIFRKVGMTPGAKRVRRQASLRP